MHYGHDDGGDDDDVVDGDDVGVAGYDNDNDGDDGNQIFFPLLHYKVSTSHVRYVLKIHFFIEFGLKMIQFKIQFKTKSKIFIQKNIHSIESRIFNRIIHS